MAACSRDPAKACAGLVLALLATLGCSLVACRSAPPRRAPPPPVARPTPPAPPPEPAPDPAPKPKPSLSFYEPDEASASLSQIHYELFLGDGPPPPPSLVGPQVFPERYTEVAGVLTFRGGPMRNNATFGARGLAEKKLEVAWQVTTESGDTRWGGGAGWTGEPVIIRWPDVVRHSIRFEYSPPAGQPFVEVIQGSLDGNVYFIDLATGRRTRPPIKTGNPIKGSVSVDPRGYPLLFVGQGIPGKKPIGLHIYSLISQEELFFLPGIERNAPRRWGAFDSSGLVNRNTDTFLVGGENGLLYFLKLNTRFDPIDRKIEIKPQVLRYRFRDAKNEYRGIENSVAIVRNLAFFADNSGTLQALDLRTFRPAWAFEAGDDTDASVTIELEGDRPVLYTGSEVDKQGTEGLARVRKLDGLKGTVLWEKAVPCRAIVAPRKNDAGMFATNVIGKDDVAHLAVFTLARCPDGERGLMLALDKETGEEVWRRELEHYAWSSPTDFRDESGHTWLLQGNVAGTLMLVDARTGEIAHSLQLNGAIEASPAIFDDMAVIATRGQTIYGIRLR